MRFNKLLKTVKTSLKDMEKAIAGFIIMNADLEGVCNALFDNNVPEL